MPAGAALRTIMVAGGGGSFTPPPPPELDPASTIGVTRNGGNPTFNFNALPENMIQVGATYYAVFQPGADGVHLASSSSPAGPWTSLGSILTGGSQGWETNKLYAPFLYAEGGTFYLLYSSDPTGSGGTDYSIGLATASTVTGPYTKDSGNPVLPKGGTGAWDHLRVGEPAVIKVGSTYYLYYMGEAGNYPTDYQQSERIGVASATSMSGPWTKDGSNPILTVGAGGQWDDFVIADPDVIFSNGYYWLYYTGSTSASVWTTGLAYATSPNGPYTKHTSNPILVGAGGAAWDGKYTFRGGIFHQSGLYHVIYAGHPNSGLALANFKGGNAVLTIT